MSGLLSLGGLVRVGAALALMFFLGMPGESASGNLTFRLTVNPAGYIETPLKVNDVLEVPAIIDTAATIAMIDSAAARRAGIEAPSPDEIMVPVYGLLGEREFPITSISSLTNETVRIFHVPAAYNNREPMPGGSLVVPAISFEGDVLDFDFPDGRFSVYNGRPRGDGSTSGRGKLKFENGLMFTEVTVNGVKGRALIDTGSPFSFINSRMALEAKAQSDEEKTRSLIGATGGAMSVSVATVKRLSVARFNVSRLNMIVADPALFRDLGIQDEPAMLLGLDLLSLFRVQIDRRRGYLILTPRDEGQSMTLNLNPRGSRIPQ